MKTRLRSLDTAGLSIDRLSGHTLVQYTGSLTGRDFRAIVQVVPFILYDLVSDACFKSWVLLSTLIPLIWQPIIPNIDEHSVSKYAASPCRVLLSNIEFLVCVTEWMPHWFNKPKFHIILHLVTHIRHFGPASLFATEAFESFNAVICAKSVHSNRHALSRDIACAFAQGNYIRHMLSGAYVCFRPQGQTVESWQPVGAGPQDLVAHPSILIEYLGLKFDTDTIASGKLPSLSR